MKVTKEELSLLHTAGVDIQVTVKNPKLLWAAPDLLDACKAALIELQDPQNKIGAITTVKRAIEKAEGKLTDS